MSSNDTKALEGFASTTLTRARRAVGDRRLFERYRRAGDLAAREALIQRFLPLARRLARRYRSPSEPFDDLFQIACVGLMKAVDNFDPERGIAFSSYAVPTILGELKRYYRDRTWSVHVPRELQELGWRVERVTADLTAELSGTPSPAQIAERIGAPVKAVEEAMAVPAAYHVASLEAPNPAADTDADSLGATISVTDPGFDLAEDRASLQELMATLTAHERRVVCLFFDEDLTQEEIGERVGVSQMQVSRIIRQSLMRLRGAAPSRVSALRARALDL